VITARVLSLSMAPHSSSPRMWSAMRSCKPFDCQLARKPECTNGRVASHREPRIGGWADRHTCRRVTPADVSQGAAVRWLVRPPHPPMCHTVASHREPRIGGWSDRHTRRRVTPADVSHLPTCRTCRRVARHRRQASLTCFRSHTGLRIGCLQSHTCPEGRSWLTTQPADRWRNGRH
jgi:hypothetical protein